MTGGVSRNYTIINHVARIALKVSITEYCVFDLIHHLATNPKNSKNRWCYAKKETIADYLALNRATVFRTIKKGLAQGLLEKHPKQPTFLRATKSWYESVQIHTVANRTLQPQSSQLATTSSRILRLNNNRDKDTDNIAVQPQKTIAVIGDILDQYHLPRGKEPIATAWQVEAKRLWLVLGLSGEPSQQFFRHIKDVYTKKQHRKLANVISYCKDAEGIRDREKFFYWRYAHDH